MIRKSERFNQLSRNIDRLDVSEILTTINQIDQEIPQIVLKALPALSNLTYKALEALKQGGRVIYMASGASADICHADAQEMPGTYGVDFDLIRSIHLQLGPNWDWKTTKAISFENRDTREDGKEQLIIDLKSINWTKKDFVIGVSASGTTPVIVAALAWVKANGGKTGCLVNNVNSPMGKVVDVEVAAQAGPEAISGSTRMKSGTITKLLANSFSTALMIKLGNVYQGLMVGLRIGPKNDLQKFEERAIRILREITGLNQEEAQKLLDQSDTVTSDKSDRNLKVAIIMHKLGCEAVEAKKMLIKHHGNIHEVLKDL